MGKVELLLQDNNFSFSHNANAQNFPNAFILKQNNVFSTLNFKKFTPEILSIRAYRRVFPYGSVVEVLLLMFFNASFVISPILLYTLPTHFQISHYLQLSLFFFIVGIFILMVLFVVVRHRGMFTLHIDKDGLEIEGRKVRFVEIRAVMKHKDPIGYSLYIYGGEQILPVALFAVDSIHEANAIEQVVLGKMVE